MHGKNNGNRVKTKFQNSETKGCNFRFEAAICADFSEWRSLWVSWHNGWKEEDLKCCYNRRQSRLEASCDLHSCGERPVPLTSGGIPFGKVRNRTNFSHFNTIPANSSSQ